VAGFLQTRCFAELGIDRKQQAMQQIPMPSTTSTAAAQLDASLAALLAELYC